MTHKLNTLSTWGILFLLLFGLLAFGCSDDDDPAGPTTTEFDVLQPAINSYVSDATQAPTVSAQALFDNVNDGNAANDYFILSVRSAEHYALGHIDGAINIPWRDIGKTASLAVLPTDKPIAVYCYTGHTAGIATALLNTMGFQAYNLKFGIGSWTKDQTVRVAAAFNDANDAHDFTFEIQMNTPTETFDIPATDYTSETDADAIMHAACDFVATNIPATTTAQAVFDNLNDGNAANDPVIVSVRSAEHYAIGHLPGAINIPWREIALESNLQKLDSSKEIVVYCYTGHTGAVATTALRLLGYDAVNMKFGIMAWTRDASVRVSAAFSETTDAHDFPVKAGANP